MNVEINELDSAKKRLLHGIAEVEVALGDMWRLSAQVRAPPIEADSLPDMLSVGRIAERLSISETTVRDLLDRGDLQEARLPGIRRRLVRREDYLAYIRRATKGEPHG